MAGSNSIYHKLAPIYDNIMKDVDYEDWTDYIDSVIRYHHPYGQYVLEIACGTGTMALALEKRDNYVITATDISPEMIRIAKQKAEREKSTISWLVQDMCCLDIKNRYEIIFMVFDSLNYLHQKEHIQSLFDGVSRHLSTDGIFLFDFTTPNYSPKIAPLLNGERNVNDQYSYRRTSKYDRKRAIHTNHFIVEIKDLQTGTTTEQFEEIHRQRIWTLEEIKEMVFASKLRMLAAYEDFDFSEANSGSDRITMVATHD